MKALFGSALAAFAALALLFAGASAWAAPTVIVAGQAASGGHSFTATGPCPQGAVAVAYWMMQSGVAPGALSDSKSNNWSTNVSGHTVDQGEQDASTVKSRAAATVLATAIAAGDIFTVAYTGTTAPFLTVECYADATGLGAVYGKNGGGSSGTNSPGFVITIPAADVVPGYQAGALTLSASSTGYTEGSTNGWTVSTDNATTGQGIRSYYRVSDANTSQIKETLTGNTLYSEFWFTLIKSGGGGGAAACPNYRAQSGYGC